MKRLRWLTAKAVLAIHEELIVRYGGVSGLRDDGLLESAVARPQNLAAYGQKISVASLSAAYAWGLLRNHPFVDGNKRTAFAALYTFLAINGLRLTAGAEQTCAFVIALYEANQFSFERLVPWLRENSCARM